MGQPVATLGVGRSLALSAGGGIPGDRPGGRRSERRAVRGRDDGVDRVVREALSLQGVVGVDTNRTEGRAYCLA